MHFVNVFVGTNVLFRFNDFVIIMIHYARSTNNSYLIRLKKKFSFSYRDSKHLKIIITSNFLKAIKVKLYYMINAML